MSGCPGCNISDKERQRLLKTVEKEAIAYGQEKQTHMAVYIDHETIPQFMELEAAKLAGVHVVQYLPFVPGNTGTQLSNGALQK